MLCFVVLRSYWKQKKNTEVTTCIVNSKRNYWVYILFFSKYKRGFDYKRSTLDNSKTFDNIQSKCRSLTNLAIIRFSSTFGDFKYNFETDQPPTRDNLFIRPTPGNSKCIFTKSTLKAQVFGVLFTHRKIIDLGKLNKIKFN